MKIFFVSLGCDKNLVDSEKMLALLAKEGFEMTQDEAEADVIVVNTCCFIHDAKEESIETIIEMAQYKEEGNCKALVIAGCLAERYHTEIESEIPEVDGIVGTTAIEKIVPVVKEALENGKSICLSDLNKLPKGLTERVLSNGGFTSYLKIAEGCNKHCTYCIIPKLRGNYRSVPMEELIEEANALAEKGITELILVAQETTVYGVDLYGEKKLPELLEKLCKIPELQMIRVLYCYPEEITKELAQVMADNTKICNYIDMPIQHCSDVVLKRMGRRTNKEELIQCVNMLRSEVPDIAIRTTLITGFPGETEAQHEELIEFVKEMKFDRLGVFTYSQEEGTPAADYDDQVEEEVKARRQDELMSVQRDVVFKKNEDMVGKKIRAVVDGYLPEEEVYVARTYMDAPGVDGCIFFEASYEIVSGTQVILAVTDASGYDLIGVLQEEA